ncbi:RNA polymerase sigma factor [Actinocorallia populi]|uniref:RNA polymerase sigma factor n=1 Tax=Actinocorallia populi TaxID=2079200 RepID=UPI000D08BB88|nr:sigma-70 family RNA polymerase sigma factor [Actinocorallia populi]
MTLHSRTDLELWGAAVAGDEQAFGELFARHGRVVYNFCFRRTADWSAAEDLASVVFLETWRRREHVRLEGGSLLPWLYGVATNVLRNHQRSLRRYGAVLARVPEPVAPEEDADLVAARLDDQRRMREVLDRIAHLPRRDRELLALCVWEGLTYTEAAAALGIPVGTVRSRLSRIRAGLKEPPPLPGHRRRNNALREELS